MEKLAFKKMFKQPNNLVKFDMALGSNRRVMSADINIF
jgi:hypothetical protein